MSAPHQCPRDADQGRGKDCPQHPRRGLFADSPTASIAIALALVLACVALVLIVPGVQ